MTAHDPVNHPIHYTSHKSGVEAIEVTEHLGFNLGNAFKYLVRRDLKGGAEDVRKAVWYIRRQQTLPQPPIGMRGVDSMEHAWTKAELMSSYEPFPFNVVMREIVVYALGWSAAPQVLETCAVTLEKWLEEGNTQA